MTVIPVQFGPPTEVIDGFRSPQVCAIADVTYRQLDYWDRTSLAEPSIRAAKGSGTQRYYSEQDVLRISVISTLLRVGFSLGVMRTYVDQIMANASGSVASIVAEGVVITVDLATIRARMDLFMDAS